MKTIDGVVSGNMFLLLFMCKISTNLYVVLFSFTPQNTRFVQMTDTNPPVMRAVHPFLPTTWGPDADDLSEPSACALG